MSRAVTSRGGELISTRSRTTSKELSLLAQTRDAVSELETQGRLGRAQARLILDALAAWDQQGCSRKAGPKLARTQSEESDHGHAVRLRVPDAATTTPAGNAWANQSSPWATGLPSPAVSDILRKVSEGRSATIAKVRNVCKDWRRMALQSLDLLVLHPTVPQAADAWCHSVERVFGSVGRIEMVQYEEDIIMTGPTAEHLFAGAKGIHNLQKVSGKVEGLSDPVLQAVSGLSGLKQLRLEGYTRLMSDHLASVTRVGLSSLTALTNLETLLLSVLTCPSDDLMVLCGMTSLKSLKLDTSSSVDAELISGICSSLSNLSKLELCNKNTHDDMVEDSACLSSLTRLTRLEHLMLEISTSDDVSWMKHLTCLTRLRRLRLPHTMANLDPQVAHLRHLTALDSLDLGDNMITSQGLKQVTVLSALRNLCLQNCVELTDSSMACLSQLTGLTVLDLNSVKLTPMVAEILPRSLTALNLCLSRGETAAESEGVRALAQLPPRLSALTLDFLNYSEDVQDRGLEDELTDEMVGAVLRPLRWLELVEVIGAAIITPTGVAQALLAADLTRLTDLLFTDCALISSNSHLETMRLVLPEGVRIHMDDDVFMLDIFHGYFDDPDED